MRKLITTALAALAAGGTVLAAVPASAASAAPVRPVTASTHLSGRPDSGGNGNWAADAMTRTLTVRPAGGTSYTATVTDSAGSFATVPGDFVPNQAADPGVKFTQRIDGSFSGHASYSFTASEAPNARLVPRKAAGTAPADTSGWYKLAFPAGTVFGGTGIESNWGWSYSAGCLTISHAGRFSFTSQSWNDFASNNGGQGPGSPAAGSITDFAGRCLPVFFGF
jgi:hypothetical protein